MTFFLATFSMFACHSYFINWIIYTIVRNLWANIIAIYLLKPLGRIIPVPILIKPFGEASSIYSINTTQSSNLQKAIGVVADLVCFDEKSYSKIILCFPIVGSTKKMNQNCPWLMKNPIKSIICFLEESFS